MTIYPDEQKTSLIERRLPPHNVRVPQLSSEPGIPQDTLYGGRRQARRARGVPVGPAPAVGERWSSVEKFAMVVETAAFHDAYAARAGVEGTLSQGVRDCDLRRSRYIGLAKTRLHHLLAATALNLIRVGAWLADRPRAKTRRSTFAALAPAPS